MKKIAQTITSLLFISIVTKSFFKSVNLVDAIILIAVTVVFCLYEMITEREIKKELEDYKKENAINMQKLEQSLTNTKDYMSKFSAGQALRK